MDMAGRRRVRNNLIAADSLENAECVHRVLVKQSIRSIKEHKNRLLQSRVWQKSTRNNLAFNELSLNESGNRSRAGV